MSFVGGASFIEPINILGFPGFQGQISFGGGGYGTPGRWAEGEYGWSPPRWIVDLSLGEGWFSRLPDITQSPGLPQLVSETGGVTKTTFPLQIDLRDKPPNESQLPVVPINPGWKYVAGGMWERIDAPGIYYNDASKDAYDLGDPNAGAPTLFPAEVEDVGWITDIYDVVDTAAGGWLPGGVPIGSSLPANLYTPTPTYPVATVTTPTVPTGGVTMPTGCADDPMKGMVFKKVCGEYRWVKQKRRRRKALVSATDLKGLSSLKGILGQGKAFDIWIATHS